MKKTKIIRIFLLVIFAALIITGGVLGYDYYKDTKVDTETLLETALNNLSHRDTYRFSLKTKLQLNNYNNAETSIAGERDKNGNLHIWGEIMNTELEMYQIGETHYRYNPATKQWILLENSPLTQDPLLLMEILPETNFHFDTESKEEYLGKEVKEGKIFHKYKMELEDTRHIAQEYYTNFIYEIWVEAKSREILEATMTAKAKGNSGNTLKLAIKFYDVNQEFTVNPPE